MNVDKLLYLFKRYIDGNYVNIGEIYLYPINIDLKSKVFEFKLKNSNNICYNIEVLLDELLILTNEFANYINIKLEPTVINAEKVSINKELGDKIQNYFNSITKLEIKSKFSGEKVEIHGKSVGFDVEVQREQVFFNNHFVPSKGFVTNTINNTLVTDDLLESIEYYHDMIENQDSWYWESEHIYPLMDQILDDYPLLSPDWIAQYYSTMFTTSI
jgi:hypothetical protein